MFNKLKFYILLGISFIILLAAASKTQYELNKIRIEDQLVDQDEIKGAPPFVAFAVISLGGFRGLIADYLWMRSQILQDQGNYYETYQLAQWITILQPKLETAITNLAWNMAYNISVTYQDYEDRWRWVQKGIELLRDDALSKTKGKGEIYQWLGWIYQHKIGQEADDANRYYKWRLANEIANLMGEEYPINWERLKNAPELSKVQIQNQNLEAVLKNKNITLKELQENFRTKQEIMEAIRSVANPNEIIELTYALRKDWMLDVYKLDPVIMDEINLKYSPNDGRFYGLDWRLPESHAIYWAYIGLKKLDGNYGQCERMISQSLITAMNSGRITGTSYYQDQYGSKIPALVTGPNLNTVEPIDTIMNELMTKYGKDHFGEARQSFLIQATVSLYLQGYNTRANNFYQKLKDFYQEQGNKERLDAIKNASLVDFTLNYVTQSMNLSNSRTVTQIITGYISSSIRASLVDNDEQSVALLTISEKLHRKYQDSLGNERNSRMNIADFRTMFQETLADFYSQLPEDSRYREGLRRKYPNFAFPQSPKKE